MKRLDQLFSVGYGNKLDLNKMTIAGSGPGINFVGRSGLRQGVAASVARLPEIEPYPAGLLTTALGGSLLSTFVQQRPFYTAQNVAVLSPIDIDMPLKHRLFYAMCIRHNAFRYTTFGREANRTLSTLELPDKLPSWVDQVEVPTHEGLSKPLGPPVLLGDPTKWQDFHLDEMFTIKKGSRLTKAQRRPGPTRFIGATEKHNGITDHNDLVPKFEGGTLTVVYNGNSVGWTFYQDKPFFASDDVSVLEPKEKVPVLALLFVAAVIKHGRSRYTYGYKWNLARMKKTSIKLPADPEGQPDWELMVRFMEGLGFSSLLSKAT